MASLFYWLGLGVTVSGMSFLIHELSVEAPELAGDLRLYGRLFSIVVCGIAGFWGWRIQTGYLTFITDQRIVRYRPSFLFSQTRRMVYWGEAMKSKSINGSLLLRCCGIGTIQVMPFSSQEQEIAIDWVGQFEELSKYIDRLIYLTKREPHKLGQVKTFIPNARYDYPIELVDGGVTDVDWDPPVNYVSDGASKYYSSAGPLEDDADFDDGFGWQAAANESFSTSKKRRRAGGR